MAAGWVDTVGLHIFLEENSSFLTGRYAKMGKFIFDNESERFKGVLIIIIVFVIGAALATVITKKAGLLGGLILAGILVISTPLFYERMGEHYAFLTIPMAMGAQNAASSLTGISRTTHLTGPTTDIGISIAQGNWNQVIFWSLRWIGFLLGVFFAYNFIHFHVLGASLLHLMLIPGLTIIVTALVQRIIFNIPQKGK